MELPNIAAYAYQDVHVWSALLTCLRPPFAGGSLASKIHRAKGVGEKSSPGCNGAVGGTLSTVRTRCKVWVCLETIHASCTHLESISE